MTMRHLSVLSPASVRSLLLAVPLCLLAPVVHAAYQGCESAATLQKNLTLPVNLWSVIQLPYPRVGAQNICGASSKVSVTPANGIKYRFSSAGQSLLVNPSVAKKSYEIVFTLANGATVLLSIKTVSAGKPIIVSISAPKNGF